MFRQINKKKFKANPAIRKQLLNTGDAIIIEKNNWGDTIWGVCKGVGENYMGRILMRIRKELLNESC